MYVIGTAGHVDHGKSTLVEALTGIDPDRWEEEKVRQMTIDLGFAWLRLGDLPDEVGVVDVPGHRDFIENMLAGVGGIDLALLVVAADEGVMPQTREHLAILNLLEVGSGVVAITKADLVEDPDWLELVMLDVGETLAGGPLADAPLIPVSARTGRGLETLKAELAARLDDVPPRPDHGRPRLPIDRVFSLSGFGTIVTGTLIDGRLQVGQAIEIQPGGLSGRIRGLQTHQTQRQAAGPGSRVAVNLTGIDKDEIERGDVLAAPGVVRGTLLFDASYRHLPDAVPLKHNMEVKLFVGADEIIARTRVVGARQIAPGEAGWLQLALSRPAAVVRGDRFILRRPSPGATLGGGRVLDPHPGRRHRRFRPEVVERLQTLARGTPAELLAQTLRGIEPATREALFRQSGLGGDAATAAFDELVAGGQIRRLGDQLLTATGWSRLLASMARHLADYHRTFPLRLGMPREELRSRLRLAAAVFNPFLAAAQSDGAVSDDGSTVRALDHAVQFSPTQQTAVDALLARFERDGVNSPSVKESRTAVGDEVYAALVEMDLLQPINQDVVYRPADLQQLTEIILTHLAKKGRINAAGVRDLLGTSRKYAIALLEHLDQQRITRRVGDDRELF